MISRKFRTLNNIDPSILFLVFATLIGGYIRLSQILELNFPLGDGGLFYSMTKDLMANGYRLPVITSYNHLNLPFAYPPLSFYLSGFLADLTSWQLIDIIRILPAVFTILAIPAFYLLARALIQNKYQVVFATLIFAFVPASFNWMIMGGGLTRSPAFFLSLLALYFIYRLYTQNHFRNILWTALFCSLTILTHPEAALHTAASALVFFIFFGRNKKGLLKSILVAVLIVLATSPWWGTVLVHHGFTLFLVAGKTGFYSVSDVFRFLQTDLTHEYGLQTIGTLGLIGLFWYLAKRKYFLPIWAIVTFISDQRSATLYLTPCIAILASYSLTNILQIFNTTTPQLEVENNEPNPLSGKVSKGLFLLLFGKWVFSAMATIVLIINNISLANSDKNAFDWIKLNTPSESRFLVMTGNSPLADPVSEWFPALTNRTSIATAQGYEWDNSSSFENILTESTNVQKCIYLTYHCVESWAEKQHKGFDYLYIHNPAQPADAQSSSLFESALGDLSLSMGYTEQVYKSDGVSIYKVK